jgi:hypothetical protein
VHLFSRGKVPVSAALKGKKAASKKAAPRKAVPKKVAPKKQAAVPKPRQVENLIAGAEVPRKFTMTVQVSGREFWMTPSQLHVYKGMFNKRAEIHFIGVLNDPKNPTRAGIVDSPNLWEWRPAER